MILSLDTTSEFGSIALTDSSGTVEETLLHSPEGFGHVLFVHIDQLLSRHNLVADDIACFAATSGPGSFTGVRVGLTAVKGLAEATGRPAIAVSNLLVLASFGTAPLRAVVLDARRGDVYGAVYNAALEIISEEVVTKFPVWLERLPAGEIEFIATDFAPFRPFVGAGVPVITAPRALAGAVGRIARQRHRLGLSQDPALIDANYVRRSDAELFWTEAL